MGWGGTIIYLASITSGKSGAVRSGQGGRGKQMAADAACNASLYPSTIVVLLIMQLGKIMGGSFERIMALMNYAATEYTTTIPVLVYQWGIQDMKFSQSTALGLFQSVIGLLLVLASDFIAKRNGRERPGIREELKNGGTVKSKKKKTWNKSRVCTLIANILIYTFVAVVSLSCVLPYIHVIAKSLSSESFVIAKKVFLASQRLYYGSIR